MMDISPSDNVSQTQLHNHDNIVKLYILCEECLIALMMVVVVDYFKTQNLMILSFFHLLLSFFLSFLHSFFLSIPLSFFLSLFISYFLSFSLSFFLSFFLSLFHSFFLSVCLSFFLPRVPLVFNLIMAPRLIGEFLWQYFLHDTIMKCWKNSILKYPSFYFMHIGSHKILWNVIQLIRLVFIIFK